MARGSHWWSEPPWWAWTAIVVSAVFLVVGLPFALQRGVVPASTVNSLPPAGGATPTPTTTQPAPDAPSVVVIGDSWTAPANVPDAGWPAVLADRVPEWRISTSSAGDGGYVTPDPVLGTTFGALVDTAEDLPGADVVVLAGSAFDVAGISDQVAAASADTMRAVTDRAPDAVLVVVGPTWPTERVPAGVRNNRDVIRLSAQEAGVRFVDPLAEGWLTGDPGLVGPDGRLTDAGVAVLADRVQPLVTEALAG
jgi:hypothetical protein